MSHRTGYLYDDLFLEHELERGHPESPLRLAALHSIIAQSPLYEKLTPLSPIVEEKKITPWIATTHTPAHIDSVRECGITGRVAFRAVGGILAAIDAVYGGAIDNAFCALRPPGHHAHNDAHKDGFRKGEGFCFFNNVAIAARYAQRKWECANILIVDWDYHHGNGTEDSFYDDPTVFYFSTHRLHAYPGTGYPLRTGEGKGKGYNLNVPLPSPSNPYGRVTDENIISAFEKHLFPRLRSSGFQPDLILISAGFDSRGNDLLGDFSITDDGFYRLTEMVVRYAGDICGGKIVSALEGGYNPEGLASAGLSHVRGLLGL